MNQRSIFEDALPIVTDLDTRRRAHAAEQDAASSRRLIVAMLEARWTGMSNWADSLACPHVGHPARPNDPTVCCCGEVKYPDEGGA